MRLNPKSGPTINTLWKFHMNRKKVTLNAVHSRIEVLAVKAALVFLLLGCVSVSLYTVAMRLPADDRHLLFVVSTMFFVGAAMAWAELRNWWKTRIKQYGEPPLGNLLRFVSSPNRVSGHPQASAQSLNQPKQDIENVEPTRAA